MINQLESSLTSIFSLPFLEENHTPKLEEGSPQLNGDDYKSNLTACFTNIISGDFNLDRFTEHLHLIPNMDFVGKMIDIAVTFPKVMSNFNFTSKLACHWCTSIPAPGAFHLTHLL